MKLEKHLSIVVEDKRILGIHGYKQEGQIIIDGVYQMDKNQDANILKSLQKFLTVNDIKKENICICIKREFKSRFMQLPMMTRMEIRRMLDYQENDFIQWEKPFFTQFLARNPSLYDDDLNTMDFFLVAVEKAHIQSVAKAIMTSKNYLDIITFWPAEVNRLYEESRFIVTIRLTKEMVYFYVWDDAMLTKEVRSPLNSGALANVLEELDKDICQFNDRGIEGIHFLYDDESNLLLREEIDSIIGEDINAFYEQYGKAVLRKINYLPNMKETIDLNNISWATTLGGLIRSLCVDF